MTAIGLLLLLIIYPLYAWVLRSVTFSSSFSQWSLQSSVDMIEKVDLTTPATSQKTYFIETHGCQMNLADSDIVRAMLHSMNMTMSDTLETADLILVNTCAVREQAEEKVKQRIKYFQSLQKKCRLSQKQPIITSSVRASKKQITPYIGVLGCMAERLQSELLNDFKVDFVAGPDTYRSIPSLVPEALRPPQQPLTINDDIVDIPLRQEIMAQASVKLEETYADIVPHRLNEGLIHGFVTISRGCDNHCTFCIVPHTRGKERSLPLNAVLIQARRLIDTEGVKEVVLLGQNVNSYYDSTTSIDTSKQVRDLSDGFYGRGKRLVAPGGTDFVELLHQVALINPEVRVRFTAPHPQGFPDSVLHLIAETANICNALHMPAQHGNSLVLEQMGRGYTREAYLNLVERARSIISPYCKKGSGLGLSSDMIAGFCSETDAQHEDNVSLLKAVGFDQLFSYAYSEREQTPAVRKGLQDDVPHEIKMKRLQQLVDTFQLTAQIRNGLIEAGRLHTVLIEGQADSNNGIKYLTGRTDTNKRVVFPAISVLDGLDIDEAMHIRQTYMQPGLSAKPMMEEELRLLQAKRSGNQQLLVKGDYAVVKIVKARGHTLRGVPVAKTGLVDSHRLNLPALSAH